ncbi:MAG: ribosome recycling factor [SAR86 cluster bacterium]|nr:ribosome recycling factor [SAR86 cluster bacterium]
MLEDIIEDSTNRMGKALDALETAFKSIRTGRANPSLLDSIKIDYYGSLTPLSQLANIGIEDATTLSIVPFESTLLPDIEKAIYESDIGINPATSGDKIRVIVPKLTEETRRDLIKKAKSEAENSKISIRNIRRDGNSQLKEFLKEKEISEDDDRKGQELIQNLTDEFIKNIDTSLDNKEKDLLDF